MMDGKRRRERRRRVERDEGRNEVREGQRERGGGGGGGIREKQLPCVPQRVNKKSTWRQHKGTVNTTPREKVGKDGDSMHATSH